MQQKQTGFTLIELVVVIVILGILAAVAVPKFIDLQDEANDAAVEGVAGAISSASAINYAARLANSSKGQATSNGTCSAAAGNILQGGVPTGYTVSGSVGAAGTTATCSVIAPNTTSTADATIIAVD